MQGGLGMSESESARRDVLWKMYQEHSTQGRHHETQRSTVATALIAIAGASMGFVTLDRGLTRIDMPLTVFIVAVGMFGAAFSAKHYERFSMHMERARAYRDELDSLLAGAPIKRLKHLADKEHARQFPRLEKLRLNAFWLAMYLFLGTLGVVLTGLAFVNAIPPPEQTGRKFGAHWQGDFCSVANLLPSYPAASTSKRTDNRVPSAFQQSHRKKKRVNAPVRLSQALVKQN